jgi:hypothetical protein
MTQIGTRDSQRISKGASQNSTLRDTRIISRLDVIKGTTISFTSGATISDSGNGLGSVGVGDLIQVRGSPKNSRTWEVTAAAAGSLTVLPAMVTTESAGAALQIIRLVD